LPTNSHNAGSSQPVLLHGHSGDAPIRPLHAAPISTEKNNCNVRAHPERNESFLLGCCETPEHEADHCEADKSDDGACVALEVASQTPIAADPCQGSFDNPALWNNREIMQLGSLDDFDDPTAGACGSVCHPWSAISRVGKDALYEWK
jgi:hypothetical protein